MEIYDLNSLKKGNDGLYNITEITFQDIDGVKYGTYPVQRHEEMRIDLICNSIYNNTNYVDVLLNVNRIDNPLNIKEGDVLIYPPANILDNFRFKDENKQITNILANPNKRSRKDNNRKEFIDRNYKLSPTILPEPSEPIIVRGDNIIIGENLF